MTHQIHPVHQVRLDVAYDMGNACLDRVVPHLRGVYRDGGNLVEATNQVVPLDSRGVAIAATIRLVTQPTDDAIGGLLAAHTTTVEAPDNTTALTASRAVTDRAVADVRNALRTGRPEDSLAGELARLLRADPEQAVTTAVVLLLDAAKAGANR